MSLFHSLFRSSPSASRRTRARRAGRKLRIENLEDRCLLSAVLFQDLNPGADSSNPIYLTRVGDVAYFFGTDGAQSGLFRIDATEATFVASTPTSGIYDVEHVNGHLYFAREFGMPPRYELHKVDLTTGTDSVIAATGGRGSSLDNLTAVGDRLAFVVTSVLGQSSVVRTYDGSEFTTVHVHTAFIGQPLNPTTNLTVVGDTLVFSASDRVLGRELHKTDGVSPATIVRDIMPGFNHNGPTGLAKVGDLLYFSTDDGTHGRELWVSDGTFDGTRMVEDINPGPAGSDPQNIIEGFGTYALFSAVRADVGRELWVAPFDANGGAELILDINPGPAGSDPRELITDAAGFLYFTANDGVHGRELWYSDWLPTGTYMIRDIDPRPGIGSDPQNLTMQYGYYLYFTADDGVSGRELWASDGTEQFTVLDTDLNPGLASSNPRFLVELPDGFIYFAATGPNVGRELYRASPFAGPGGAPGGGDVIPALAPTPVRAAVPNVAPRREAQAGAVAPQPPRPVATPDVVVGALRRKERGDRLFAQDLGLMDLSAW